MSRTTRKRPVRLGLQLLARPLRFGAVGLTCSAVQLGLLAVFVHLGVRHDPANLIALALSTQFNFLLSSLIIWPDRPVTRDRVRTITHRLIAFNGISLTTLLINEGVFAVADRFMPYLLAGVCGIAIAAPINYLVEHFLIFRTFEGTTQNETPGQRLRRLPGLQ
ncbi:MAG: GtrA family protein [Nitrolancea sp.]